MILGTPPIYSKALIHQPLASHLMCNNQPDNRFSSLGRPHRVWAMSSIHADLNRLIQLHDAVFERINAGDRLIYLGNYTGFGTQSRETIDELLTFRRLILAQPGMKPDDIVYLRGGQEEMWQKLKQLQFDRKPIDTLLWMMGNGMGNTMQSYGICPHDGIMAAREGIPSLTKWTGTIRQKLRDNDGHDCLMMQNRRAAFTSYEDRFPVLFVNAGLDPACALEEQNDNLCWAGETFDNITTRYDPFEKVIRGFDPAHQGVHLNCVTSTLDGGCGFGGSLVCAGMDADGDVFELMEA